MVACFAESFFGPSFFPTFQVSPVFVLSTLYSSPRHMFGDANVEGCSLGIGARGFSMAWWVRVRSCPFTSFVLRYGTDAPFICPFVVVCLQYGERLRRDFY